VLKVIEVPAELVPVQLPKGLQKGLQSRLKFFLSKQDGGENLNEAEGLVDVAEFLSLLQFRSRRVE
jgi:hypothetical protein